MTVVLMIVDGSIFENAAVVIHQKTVKPNGEGYDFHPVSIKGSVGIEYEPEDLEMTEGQIYDRIVAPQAVALAHFLKESASAVGLARK